NVPPGTHAMPAGVSIPSPRTMRGRAGARACQTRPPAAATPRTAAPPPSSRRRRVGLADGIAPGALEALVALHHQAVDVVGEPVVYAVHREVVHAGVAPVHGDALPVGLVGGVDHAVAVAVARAVRLGGEQGGE